MHRHVVVREQQGMVNHQVGVLPGRSTGLEVEVDDLFQGFAEPEEEVGRGRHRGKIDVQ